MKIDPDIMLPKDGTLEISSVKEYFDIITRMFSDCLTKDEISQRLIIKGNLEVDKMLLSLEPASPLWNDISLRDRLHKYESFVKHRQLYRGVDISPKQKYVRS